MGTPHADAFLDYFLPLISPNATFTQPIFPTAHGHVQITSLFRRMFTLMPDMTAVPTTCAVQHDIVFIESDCSATLGGKPVRFPVCDRFTIQQGQITERRSYSDPLPSPSPHSDAPRHGRARSDPDTSALIKQGSDRSLAHACRPSR